MYLLFTMRRQQVSPPNQTKSLISLPILTEMIGNECVVTFARDLPEQTDYFVSFRQNQQ